MFRQVISTKNKKSHINPEIQGHFSEHLGRCIYEGLYVGEDSDIPNVNGMRKDVIDALKEMQIPVLRWPGGCFADEYHWKDGVGPKETRKKIINTHWGGVVEDNSFGTEEFMELCKQLGCKTYINGNVGSGTVQEMSEWVEYMTMEGVSPMADMRKANGHEDAYTVNYFGVGNENWGCGGNMQPQYYSDLYRRYQTYVRTYDAKKPIFKICCGANAGDYDWTETVMRECFKCPENMHGMMDGLSLHYYTVPGTWEEKGGATVFDDAKYYQTLDKTFFMEELISHHTAIMDKYDKKKEVALIVDEWGTWYDVEPGTNPGFLYQQNTMRDAMVAAINLNIFNKHSDRVKMANIAQLVNVLQAVILTDGDKMLKTPTYHVFNMYKNHQDNDLLDSFIETKTIGTEESKIPNLSESASIDKDGVVHVTVANLSATESAEINSEFDAEVSSVEALILSDKKDAYNTFENPNAVSTKEFKEFKVSDKTVSYTIPACSVVYLKVKMK